MKYIIQIFRSSGPNVGSWNNTAWGNDDYEKTLATAQEIAKTNRQKILKVRVLEVIEEIDCENN